MLGSRVEIPGEFTEALVGEAFARKVKGQFLYCGALAGWLEWDGVRWAPDVLERVTDSFIGWIKEVEEEIYGRWGEERDTEKYQEGDADYRKGVDARYSHLIKQCRNFHAMRSARAAIERARSVQGMGVKIEMFNRHPDLLNCRNGVVDLRTGELSPHDPNLYFTQVTAVNYRAGATHPDLDKALQATSDEVRDWLKILYGYAVTGRASDDIIPVFEGKGSNGKTTVLLALSKAMGDYGHKASPQLVMAGAHQQHPTIYAELFAKRLVYIEETAEGGKLAVEQVKDLSGGGEQRGRFMRQDNFTFDMTHTLVIATNRLPTVNTADYAIWRRLRLVPFPKRYVHADDPDRQPDDLLKDTGLRDRLQHGTQQREAVLAYAVEGAQQWYREGLGYVDEITTATQKWRGQEDIIFRFLTEGAEEGILAVGDPDYKCTATALFQVYVDWCEVQNRPAGSMKTFSMRMEDSDLAKTQGVKKYRTRTHRGWEGVEPITDLMSPQIDRKLNSHAKR